MKTEVELWFSVIKNWSFSLTAICYNNVQVTTFNCLEMPSGPVRTWDKFKRTDLKPKHNDKEPNKV